MTAPGPGPVDALTADRDHGRCRAVTRPGEHGGHHQQHREWPGELNP
ncbi:hypothetical protein [Actinoplanes sp. NBRC 101535]|nr:hypothetical protein [Actinoplanes sp. NBRC 101535]